MQLFRLGDDSKHKELAALSAVLAIETSTLSIYTHQGQILSTYSHDRIYFSLILYRHYLCRFISAATQPDSYSEEYLFYQIKSEQK